ncbi:hypothetical protein H1R20_g5440, partial [Candolleomyces eurysporus]
MIVSYSTVDLDLCKDRISTSTDTLSRSSRSEEYLDETKRLYGVLEIRLTGREYLAGAGKGKYSLADIKTFPWVKTHQHACIETLDEWPNLKAWLEQALAREASESGAKVGGYN